MAELQYTPDDIARFWSHVDRSGGPEACWPWVCSLDKRGYGHFRMGHRMRPSHRVAWEIAHGPVPDGLCVCHNCPTGDTPRCVNPGHLWLGTQAENVADRDAKGRTARGDRHWSRHRPESLPRGPRNGTHTHPEQRTNGERNGQAKLTAAQVGEMRALYASGLATQVSLARRFGIGQQSVSRIVRGKSWWHVE